jgi:hypothetical protein
VVIFIIYIRYLAVLDLEHQAPVARDVQAPDALALPGELGSLPERKDPQRFRVFHILQKSEHCAEFVHSVGRQALASVLQIKSFEALMDEASYYQPPSL